VTTMEALKDIRDVLLNSDEINSYCQNKYLKNIKVFLGADERDLPEYGNAPYVLIDRGKALFESRNSARNTSCDFYMFICVYQENITDDGNGVIYDGALEADELTQIIRQVVTENTNYPIDFKEEKLLGDADISLRKYPIYALVEIGEIKLREGR
jgi:uncharacterized Fe-S cluster-containing radical SAM superfamily enzyme